MRLLHRSDATGALAPGADLSLQELQALYASAHEGSGRLVRANMVASLDGAIATDGVSAGLSGPADKAVFAALRSLCDVVLVGAGTARSEDYRPARIRPELAGRRSMRGQPVAPRIAVVSRSLDLDPDSALMRDSATLVITSASSDRSARESLARSVEVVVAGEEDVDLAAALDALTDRGLREILCEGGPTLLGGLVAAGALDELCLTMAPQLSGGETTGLLGAHARSARRLELVHVLTADDYLFTRYRLEHRSDGGMSA